MIFKTDEIKFIQDKDERFDYVKNKIDTTTCLIFQI